MATVTITKEVESRLKPIDLPLDFEDKACDLAIDVLSDIRECDNARVYVKWAPLLGMQVPLLYILFSGPASENMPKVHIDELGEMHPAHAVCLVTMPHRHLMPDNTLKSVIRRGVEEFLHRYNVKGHVGHA